MIDDYSTKGAGYYANARKDILGLILPSTSDLLDVGCGAGVLARSAKDLYKIECTRSPNPVRR